MPEWKAKEFAVLKAITLLQPECQKDSGSWRDLGYTYAEMTERLEISNGNVKSRLSRCRSKLTDILGVTPSDFLN